MGVKREAGTDKCGGFMPKTHKTTPVVELFERSVASARSLAFPHRSLLALVSPLSTAWKAVPLEMPSWGSFFVGPAAGVDVGPACSEVGGGGMEDDVGVGDGAWRGAGDAGEGCFEGDAV